MNYASGNSYHSERSEVSEMSSPRAINTPSRRRPSVSLESNTLGRSFVYSRNAGFLDSSPPTVHSTTSVHEDTANLAGVGVDDADDSISNSRSNSTWSQSGLDDLNIDELPSESQIAPYSQFSETPFNDVSQAPQAPRVPQTPQAPQTPQVLEPPESSQSSRSYGTITRDDTTSSIVLTTTTPTSAEVPDLENQTPPKQSLSSVISNLPPAKTTAKLFVRCLPPVFLGALLNILDALSYGMIMFPVSESAFSSMTSTGLSMFYVSTIISQLVYSLGGSSFKSGIGSEMIEVTPFLHQMATSIMHSLGPDKTDAAVATTMVTFAFSAIITGLCFGLLGKFRLGKLVGFFPRHILVGCVGGVGYFLVVTAIAVCSRIEGSIEYNWPTLRYLFQPLVFLQWFIPLFLTVVLVLAQHYTRSPLLVPAFIILVFIGFHLLVAVIPQWNLDSARQFGWVFPEQEAQEPWWEFYTLYDFPKVDWWLVLGEIPTMLALTFFGILHVPINVPALALSIGTDAVDVDRELLAHGVSNVLSGLAGSIQNYLVYTNSVMFIRAGADSRMSGVMLAGATIGIMVAGPGIIGYIPVCVVGTLVFLLGYELVKEALWDTLGRLRPFEYVTIVVIVATMGAVDFVIGILVGILLACLSFIVEAGSREVVSGIYTGEYARSIVVRHPKQMEFLERVGRQTCVFKLTGSLFFGSIGGLEEKIRTRFNQQAWQKEPVKYLILDMNGVPGIDFSAAEGFRRIRNVVVEKECYMLISSVKEDSVIVRALEDCGLWETEEHRERVQLFNNLNSALEWCENQFLTEVVELARQTKLSKPKSMSVRIASGGTGRGKSFSQQRLPMALLQAAGGISPSDNLLTLPGSPRNLQQLSASPRKVQLLSAAQKSLSAERQDLISTISSPKQPLPLLLKVMQGLSDSQKETFWAKLCPYLKKIQTTYGEMIYDKNHSQPAVFFVEHGLVEYEISFNNMQFSLKSSVLPLTMFGDVVRIPSDRRIVYRSAAQCTIWKLDKSKIDRLKKENTVLYEQLLVVSLRLATQRYDTITSNIIVSS
ncbi:hypothetical protein FOA43_001794 [Brettanomyces nanus]|uniref:Sulfate transporter n=1 Tax=Eeniella nana TaxID=13502 RepID=A0A875S5I9_EENNA|nr:uncharacterized protein FOA43_001794 [Brettanomyces nanus]QPG74464.1 hypothetical protein FOA43_001794 [Brettanomyces nanus]